jgi:FKBP-type peptidyl-prolyl cis-trans isomerase
VIRALRSALVVLSILALWSCSSSPVDPRVVAAGKAFLTANAHAPGVHVTPSGLQYKIISSGPVDGARPKLTDDVKVNYEGKLLDGTIFDSTYKRGASATFSLSGLISGWIEALQMMRPGDVWELYVPAELGYGDDGAPQIPPGSVLEFRIELVGLNVENGGGV